MTGAPTRRRSGAVSPAAAGSPHPLPPGAPGPGRVETYTAFDGRTLGFRVIAARGSEVRRLIYLHGIESHGAWFLRAAHLLAEHGCTTYLVDRRGSGLNRREQPGDASSAATLLDDLRAFRGELGIDRAHIVGLSWGGKLALAHALANRAGTASLTLITPGLVPRVDLRRRDKLRLLCDLPFGCRRRFAVPIEPEMFTTTPAYLDYIRSDPLRTRDVTGRLLLAGRGLDRRIRRGIAELDRPTLLLLAGRDRIIDNDGVRRLLGRSSAAIEETCWPDATHSLQFDQADELCARMLAFYAAQEEGKR